MALVVAVVGDAAALRGQRADEVDVGVAVLCSWFQSSARQQPGEPVIESPSGMMRTGAVAARCRCGAVDGDEDA